MKKLKLKQAKNHDKNAKKLPPLEEDDVVRMKAHKVGDKKWQKGVVTQRLDERSYEIETDTGTYRRNCVHLRKSKESVNTQGAESIQAPQCDVSTRSKIPINVPNTDHEAAETMKPQSPTKHNEPAITSPTGTPQHRATPMMRRSQRTIRPPVKYGNYTPKEMAHVFR